MGKIRIGSPIFTKDGQQAGEVDRVVVDPKSGRLVQLVAREKNLLTRDVVLPIEVVRDWRDDAVFLDLDVLDLEGMPEYVEDDFVSPAPEETPIGPYRHGEVLFGVAHVRHSTPSRSDLPLGKSVVCHEGFCGTIEEVLLDPVTGQVLALHLRRAGLLSRDVVVPVEWVLDAMGDRVRIDCNVSQLEESLPPAHALGPVASE